MGDERSRMDRAVEYAVHVPVGFVAFARDSVPTFVQMFAGRGKREVDAHHKVVHTRINNYRSMGQLAVQYGPPYIRQRLVEHLETLRAVANETFASMPIGDRGPETVATTARIVDTVGERPAPAPAAAPVAPVTPAVPAPDPASLAIPDYDGLAASQIIERLAGLDAGELDAVDTYERATRARRTVLGKIAILRAS